MVVVVLQVLTEYILRNFYIRLFVMHNKFKYKKINMFNDSRSSCLLQVLTEYIIVSVTSAVAVTVAGVVKEAMTIFGYYNMCHFYNHVCWELTNWTRHWLSTLSRCLTMNISWDPILEVSNQNPISILHKRYLDIVSTVSSLYNQTTCIWNCIVWSWYIIDVFQ